MRSAPSVHLTKDCNNKNNNKNNNKTTTTKQLAVLISGVEWLYRENSLQLKSFKIDPPGLTTGLFDLRIGSGVFLLSAIASSTASGVLCGPISLQFGTDMATKTKSHSSLTDGDFPQVAKVEWFLLLVVVFR